MDTPRWGACGAVVVLLLSGLPALGEDDLVRLTESVVKVSIGPAHGTGFVMAAPREEGGSQLLLVTAGHSFRPKADTAKVIARKKREDGKYDRVELRVPLVQDNKPLFVVHPEADVGVLRLVQDELRPFALPLECLAPADDAKTGLRLGDDIWISGYPVGIEGTTDGFGLLRRGTVASFPLTPVKKFKTFVVDAATLGGDSGSPVIVRAGGDRTRPMIVGVMVGKHLQASKITLNLEERTIQQPLDLGIVVQAEYIRQTIALVT